MVLGSPDHRITHQLRPINMNGRSILSEMSKLFSTTVAHVVLNPCQASIDSGSLTHSLTGLVKEATDGEDAAHAQGQHGETGRLGDCGRVIVHDLDVARDGRATAEKDFARGRRPSARDGTRGGDRVGQARGGRFVEREVGGRNGDRGGGRSAGGRPDQNTATTTGDGAGSGGGGKTGRGRRPVGPRDGHRASRTGVRERRCSSADVGHAGRDRARLGHGDRDRGQGTQTGVERVERDEGRERSAGRAVRVDLGDCAGLGRVAEGREGECGDPGESTERHSDLLIRGETCC